MRLPRVLLLVSAVAGVFSALATLFSEPRVALQSGLLASVVFLGYVLLVDRVAPRLPAPRVRRALAAGIGLFALVMALELSWLPAPLSDGWLTPFYAPMEGAGGLSFDTVPEIVNSQRQVVDRNRIAAVGLLLGSVALAVAVLALPVRQRPRRALLTRIAAVLLVVVAVLDAGDRVNDAPLSGALGVGWPALLALLVAAGALAVSAGRSDRFALVPLGALLVALTAAAELGDAVATWSAWWSLSAPRDSDAFLSVGVRMAPARLTDVSAALQAAVALAGPALLALGALRASHEADGG